jgi:hypothetical protein
MQVNMLLFSTALRTHLHSQQVLPEQAGVLKAAAHLDRDSSSMAHCCH